MYPRIVIDIPSLTSVGARLEFYSAENEVNVSHASEVVNELNANVLGFQLDVTELDGTYTLFGPEGYEGYLGSASSANITMKVFTVGPINLKIVFDKASGEYAQTIVATVVGDSSAPNYGRSITITNNNKVELMIDISSLELQDQQLVQFTFSDWSVNGHCIKVEQINANYLLEYTGDIISFNCSENFMDSNLKVNPGICEQYADVEIYDRNSVLRNLALKGKLHEDETVYISVITFDANNQPVEESLGTWYVSDWNIDANKSRIKINCRDIMYRLENINIARTTIQERSVNDFLNLVFSQAPGFNWQYQDSETATRCSNIKVPNSWYNTTNLKEILNKICGLGMLRIYWYNEMFYIGRAL